MSQAIADSLRDRAAVIAVQDAFRLAPWADMLYGCDSAWWLHHRETALKFAGLKVSCDDVPLPAVLKLKQSGTQGFDPDPACIRTGRNSGYQALHIAARAGASRVLLCGYDMQGSHFFGRHPAGLRNTEPGVFNLFCKAFDTLKPALRALGCEVLNCTPGSRLTTFPFADLQASL